LHLLNDHVSYLSVCSSSSSSSTEMFDRLENPRFEGNIGLFESLERPFF